MTETLRFCVNMWAAALTLCAPASAQPAATADDPRREFCGRQQSMKVLAPSRTVVAYVKKEDEPPKAKAAPKAKSKANAQS
jgi:cytochrome c556